MQHTESYWMKFVTFQLILGPVVGIIVGYVGGKLVLWAVNKNWMSGSFQRLSIIGLSLLAFFIADTGWRKWLYFCFFLRTNLWQCSPSSIQTRSLNSERQKENYLSCLPLCSSEQLWCLKLLGFSTGILLFTP